jgi:dihydroneopterin aldolase
MSIIRVNDIKLYAYHGCLPEEAIIGGNYIVDVVLHTDFSEAAVTDDLTKTIDYCHVNDIVEKEMAVRSKLIEHVAQRILNQLNASFSQLSKAEVTVTKVKPPINGNVGNVAVTVEG